MLYVVLVLDVAVFITHSLSLSSICYVMSLDEHLLPEAFLSMLLLYIFYHLCAIVVCSRYSKAGHELACHCGDRPT